MKEFDGHLYYDDRLFVLHLCLGTVDIDDELVTTTIYHENPPRDAIWCLVTYKNCDNYPASSVLHFQNRDEAIEYLRWVEPATPLISRGGQSALLPLAFDAYTQWKKDEGLLDYDYRRRYQPGGSNPREIIMQGKEQFLEFRNRVSEWLRLRPE